MTQSTMATTQIVKNSTETSAFSDESAKNVTTGKLVGFWRRWTAMLVDVIIFSPFGIGISLLLKRDPFSLDFSSSLGMADFWITVLGILAITFCLLLFNDGQTLGMQLLGIQLKKENGKKLDFATVLVRWLGSILSGLALNIGYLWCAWDAMKQTWHDKMAGTIVVEKRSLPTSWIVIFFIASIVIVTSINVYSVSASLKEGWSQLQDEKKQSDQAESSELSDSQASTLAETQVLLDRSQALFAQIRSAETPKEVVELNDKNLAILKEAAELEPDNLIVLMQLSNAYTWSSSKGSLEEGLAVAQKALSLAPENVDLMAQVAMFQIKMGKSQDGVLLLEKVLREDDNNPNAHYWIAVGYANLKILDQAREHFEKSIAQFEAINEDGFYDARILSIRSELASI